MTLSLMKASMTIEELLESGGGCGNLAILPLNDGFRWLPKSEEDPDDMDNIDMVLTTDAVRRGMCGRLFDRCCNTKLMTVTVKISQKNFIFQVGSIFQISRSGFQ